MRGCELDTFFFSSSFFFFFFFSISILSYPGLMSSYPGFTSKYLALSRDKINVEMFQISFFILYVFFSDLFELSVKVSLRRLHNPSIFL